MTTTAPAIRYPLDSRAERILKAALTEFTRRGVGAARMRVVARRAGVSLATLRQYFPNRDELFREVVRSTIARMIQLPPEPAPAAAGRPLAERLRQFMRQFWRAMEDPDRAVLLRLSLDDLSGFRGRAASRLEAILGDGIRRGDIRLLDVGTSARVVLPVLLAYAPRVASPELRGELTGPDRKGTEQGVIDFLVGTLERSGRAGVTARVRMAPSVS